MDLEDLRAVSYTATQAQVLFVSGRTVPDGNRQWRHRSHGLVGSAASRGMCLEARHGSHLLPYTPRPGLRTDTWTGAEGEPILRALQVDDVLRSIESFELLGPELSAHTRKHERTLDSRELAWGPDTPHARVNRKPRNERSCGAVGRRRPHDADAPPVPTASSARRRPPPRGAQCIRGVAGHVDPEPGHSSGHPLSTKPAPAGPRRSQERSWRCPHHARSRRKPTSTVRRSTPWPIAPSSGTLVDELRQQKQAMPVGAAVPSERALAVAGHDLIHLATWPARKEID